MRLKIGATFTFNLELLLLFSLSPSQPCHHFHMRLKIWATFTFHLEHLSLFHFHFFTFTFFTLTFSLSPCQPCLHMRLKIGATFGLRVDSVTPSAPIFTPACAYLFLSGRANHNSLQTWSNAQMYMWVNFFGSDDLSPQRKETTKVGWPQWNCPGLPQRSPKSSTQRSLKGSTTQDPFTPRFFSFPSFPSPSIFPPYLSPLPSSNYVHVYHPLDKYHILLKYSTTKTKLQNSVLLSWFCMTLS